METTAHINRVTLAYSRRPTLRSLLADLPKALTQPAPVAGRCPATPLLPIKA